MHHTANISRRLLSMPKMQSKTDSQDQDRDEKVRQAAALFLNNAKLQPYSSAFSKTSFVTPSYSMPTHHLLYYDESGDEPSSPSDWPQTPALSYGVPSAVSTPAISPLTPLAQLPDVHVSYDQTEAEEIEDQIVELPKRAAITSPTTVPTLLSPKHYDIQYERRRSSFDAHFSDEHILDMILKNDKECLSGRSSPTKARHPLKPPPALEPKKVNDKDPQQRKDATWRKQSCVLERKEPKDITISHGTLVLERRQAVWRNTGSGKAVHSSLLRIPSDEELFRFTLETDVNKRDDQDAQRSRYQLPSYNTTIACRSCHGSGVKECTACYNQPTVPCFWCSSTGKKNGKADSTSSDCTQCSGKGQLPCRQCQQQVETMCTKCEGGNVQVGLFIDVSLHTIRVPAKDCTHMNDADIVKRFQEVVQKTDNELRRGQPVILRSAHCAVEHTQTMDVVLYTPTGVKRVHQAQEALHRSKWIQTSYSISANELLDVRRTSQSKHLEGRRQSEGVVIKERRKSLMLQSLRKFSV